VAVNGLWPATVIATDALNMIDGIDPARCRTPAIVADAAHAVLSRPAAGFHGQFLIDQAVLASAGVTDFSGYAVDPTATLMPDLFL
jgi:citronellol/citronellal dehydrogenase